MGNKTKVQHHDRLEVYDQMGNSSHELADEGSDRSAKVSKDLQKQSQTLGPGTGAGFAKEDELQ